MNKHYDIITIQQYLAGKLSAKDMYDLERHALKDPMLQDAIDGFESTNTSPYKGLSILQQRLETRITKQYEERNHFFFGRQRLAIASIAGVLFTVACILFWMINYPAKKANQQSTMKEVSVNLQSAVKISSKSGNLEPIISWEDYNHYLTINHQEQLAGKEIEISFTILNHRPSSIKVVSSGNEPAAKEIIRLLEAGPDWNGNAGVLTITF